VLVACHIIKDKNRENKENKIKKTKNKNRIWMRLAQWNDVTVIKERKETDFVDNKFSRQTLAVATIDFE